MVEEQDTQNATFSFPYLGSLEDGEPFQYLLLSIDDEFAKIAVLEWLVNRVKLNKDMKVELYIPEKLTTEYRFRNNASGIVISTEHNPELKGEVYKIALNKLPLGKISEHKANPKEIQIHNNTLPELLKSLIKDSTILKNGVRIYLKHLIPYFSRIVHFSRDEYLLIEKFFLHDLEKRIKTNESKLQTVYENLQSNLKNTEEIPILINLEELREALESEISVPVFNIIFSEQKRIVIAEQFKLLSEDTFTMYVNAIKNLEMRLYSNYNQIVIIYMKSLMENIENLSGDLQL